MKNTFSIVLTGVIFITAISCSKKDAEIDLPEPPKADLISHDLQPYYPRYADGFNSQYELIISTADGEILVDTVTDINASASISFKSTESRVNVTTIGYNKQLSKYEIQTYKGVNPDQWDTLSFGLGHRIDLNPTGLVPSKLVFNNVPNNVGAPYISSYASYLGEGGSLGYSGTTIEANYYKCSNTPVYLLLPPLALYSLNYPTKSPDTIRLQKMDTAVQMKFQKNENYDILYFDLVGLVDSTDFSRANDLYNSHINFFNNINNIDLLYPGKYFQTYQLTAMAINNNNNAIVDHFSYGDSVRTVLNLPSESNYTISSSSYNHFAINFLDITPAYYSTTWTINGVEWKIYASPDSSDLMPHDMMKALQAKSFYLKSINLDNLKLYALTFDNMKNIDFDTYLNFTFNSKRRTKRLIYYSDIYSTGL
jgi:hypothetical protein